MQIKYFDIILFSSICIKLNYSDKKAVNCKQWLVTNDIGNQSQECFERNSIVYVE